ncbi:hypothetical protein AR158_C601L [Paramecium bursaria Chlorella virus AR158]|uniref:hypothetical protein n=1 Tax=Paramecium bursaria Chlorella virus AR158 TaxID=380598 RepID=UPI00015AA7C2|nr:hypothetical protein AR158_C601L [Paramecium bursaria Chlorella virus AR158]ABU44146.1 hypothetical protein AR158_C601L [Paramecium bursaria Chlorella virus AR158]
MQQMLPRPFYQCLQHLFRYSYQHLRFSLRCLCLYQQYPLQYLYLCLLYLPQCPYLCLLYLLRYLCLYQQYQESDFLS